ncbi:sulfite exporter TauE/SafE family protein [Vibrio sp. WXL210]|uniref:sulfite exporter TauE/SafE family protein n=1 Tax=Vibrio sp. WXL210 TaxID=3450709 RepID=UPI003EC559DE
MNLDLIGAFMVGIAGSVHCMGMCGGIASLVSLGSEQQGSSANRLSNIVGYNLGRLSSYALFGALLGGALASLIELSELTQAFIVLRLLAAVIMIALGLYIAQWWFGILKIEQMGKGIWRIISPLTKRWLPIRSPLSAIPLGFLWGWLPCGLVYSMLTWAVISGGASEGALVMLAFGLGTLPSMLAFGIGSVAIQQLKASSFFKKIAGITLIAYGLYSAVHVITMMTLH